MWWSEQVYSSGHFNLMRTTRYYHKRSFSLLNHQDERLVSLFSGLFPAHNISLRPLLPYLTPVSSPSHSRALCSPPSIVGTANRLFKVAFTSSWIAAESLWRPARPSCALLHFILLCLPTSASPLSIHPSCSSPSLISISLLNTLSPQILINCAAPFFDIMLLEAKLRLYEAQL